MNKRLQRLSKRAHQDTVTPVEEREVCVGREVWGGGVEREVWRRRVWRGGCGEGV